MATRTIHTLAYKLLVDNSKFDKGMVASRGELSSAKRLMKELITPAEKMEVEFAKLGKLLKKGAIDQDFFNRKQAQLRAEYEANTEAGKAKLAAEERLNRAMERGKSLTSSLMTATERHNHTVAGYSKLLGEGAINQEAYNRAVARSKKSIPSLTNSLKKYGKAIAAASAALLVYKGRSIFVDQINQTDRLAKSSAKLGASTEFLSRLQFAASRTSGFADGQTEKAIEKMTRRVSEAAAGTGEAKKVLEELGLSAKALSASGPEKAFIQIARAMDKVTGEHDRLRIATKLFDDEQAGIHTTLKLTNAELDKQFGLADKLGATVSAIDASNAERAKDALTDLSTTFDALSRSFAIEFAPGITQLLQEVTNVLGELGGGRSGEASEPNYNATAFDAFTATTRTAGQFLNGDFDKGLIQNMDAVFHERLGREQGQYNEAKSKAEKRNQEKIARDREVIQKANAAKQAEISKAAAAKKEEADKKAEEAANAKEQAMAKLRERGGKITDLLMSKEEKRIKSMREQHEAMVKQLGQLKELRQSGDIDENTLQLGSKLLREQAIKNSESSESPKDTDTETTRIDPLAALAAGSSEAFKFSNQTTAIRNVELDLAKQQTQLAGQQVGLLESISETLADTKRPDQSRVGGSA